jgi:hypothetical protein
MMPEIRIEDCNAMTPGAKHGNLRPATKKARKGLFATL